jgi:hypothetical protein
MLKTEFTYTKKVVYNALVAIGMLLFNVGHWMFSNKYFSMSRQAPYKLSQKEVPKSIVECDKITNWVLLSLNVIPPILFFAGYVGPYFASNYADSFNVMRSVSFLVAMFVPIVSGIYLFTALYLIKKSVGNGSQVNIKAMTLHATSFGLYMVSVLLFIFIWLMYLYSAYIDDEAYSICLGITSICSSLSQAVLCIIFWDLGRKKETTQPRLRQEHPKTVINEDHDLEKQREPQQQPRKKQEPPKKVVDYSDDESEEEPETIYNSAEARRLFRI